MFITPHGNLNEMVIKP